MNGKTDGGVRSRSRWKERTGRFDSPNATSRRKRVMSWAVTTYKPGVVNGRQRVATRQRSRRVMAVKNESVDEIGG